MCTVIWISGYPTTNGYLEITHLKTRFGLQSVTLRAYTGCENQRQKSQKDCDKVRSAFSKIDCTISHRQKLVKRTTKAMVNSFSISHPSVVRTVPGSQGDS